MINFICLGTGSKGNCYLLKSEKETLILDCGIPIKKIKQGLDYNISNVAGVCVSHFHGDHALALKDLENIGLRVFTPTKDERVGKFLGKFYVDRFELPHDGTENYGFFIKIDGQTILYLTDFEYCKYRFDNLKVNHIIIEANHSTELLDKEKANYVHSIRGHANIDTTCKFIEINKTDHLRTVVLVHLSNESGDDKIFKKMVERVVDCPVYVAINGLEIELKEDNCPF